MKSNKCVCKTVMALKPSQIRVTTFHPQANTIIERLHKVAIINYMLRSFELENTHKNQAEKEDNLFDF
jgi:hypothetical protein